MTNFAKALAALALSTAIAAPAFADTTQLAASIGVPADVAATLSLGELATIKAVIEADDNLIDTYSEFVAAYR